MPSWPRAVVFDLDGTLVDTAPDLHAYLNVFLAENGRPGVALDAVRRMVGDGVRALLVRGFEATGGVPDEGRLDRLTGDFIDRYSADPCRASLVYPGATAVLDRLAAEGRGLGVCTNKPRRPTDRILEILGLARHFGAVVGGDDLPVKKPDPGHLAAVLDGLGFRAADAVYVGDSRNDVDAARGLGVPCVLLSHGYTIVPATELGADAVIDSFAELPAALAGLKPPA